MKRISLALLSVFCSPSLFAIVGPHIIPAGSLVGCTIAEPHISSKTTAIGDPVLCQVGHSARYGSSILPYNSYLVGRFEDYKDPGHFVGKGWMELKFDRMVIQPDTVIPVEARVVDVPGFRVDNQGRILGKGHVARDVAMWSIPILWPVDLLMLPMRGPRPTLKQETRLTLKLMDDLAVPATQLPLQDPNGLMYRQPSAEIQPPPPPMPESQPQPDQYAYAPQPDYSQPQQPDYPPAQPDYAQPAYPPPAPPVAYGYGGPMVVAPPVAVYGYGLGIYGFGARGYGYGYAGRPGAYGYGLRPRAYGYGGAARGYGGAARGYGYARVAPRGAMAYGGARASVGARGGYGARGGGRR